LRTTAYCLLGIMMLLSALACGATTEVSGDLQAAIDAASPGDTLSVSAGVYDRITIEKSLNLIGDGAVILAGERDACVDVRADQVNISGFVVRNGFYGIKLNSVQGCHISKNTVIHCVQPGIALLFSDNNTVEGNNASFNGLGGEGWYGIYLSNSNQNKIMNNVACNNGAYGIDLFPSCSNNTISGNILQRNMYGLYMFTDCADNLIEGNVMSENTNSGLDMRFNCHHNTVINNTIENNVVAGVTLMSSGQNLIKGNQIDANGRYGLQIQSGSDDNLITNNTISESQTGLFLDSTGNRIFSNTIAENVVQAEDRDSNIWNASYPVGGNLWSDYIGIDEMSGAEQNLSGEDGFGDSPYRINERAEDRYPVMGGQVQQITLANKILTPLKARSGDDINIQVALQSKYELSQVVVRAFPEGGSDSRGYARLSPSGEKYEGTLSTGLMDDGSYEIVLIARDIRGYELEESLGTIVVSAR
jgi:nitrous oxidase accessory protein